MLPPAACPSESPKRTPVQKKKKRLATKRSHEAQLILLLKKNNDRSLSHHPAQRWPTPLVGRAQWLGPVSIHCWMPGRQSHLAPYWPFWPSPRLPTPADVILTYGHFGLPMHKLVCMRLPSLFHLLSPWALP